MKNKLAWHYPNNRKIVGLIIVSTIVRLLLAYLVEFGNDEVFYRTFTIYPETNLFDHAPLINVILKLSTFHQFFDNTVINRLWPIIIAGINTWLVYNIGTKVKNGVSGWYAALFYTLSIYGSVIIGITIIPETAQLFFWLLCINLMIDILPAQVLDTNTRKKMVVFGIFVSLAILSKYSSIFLWLGAILFIVFYNRKWLRDPSLYVALFTSFLFILPVINWKSRYDWPGLHVLSNTIGLHDINLEYFFNCILAQIWYFNLINFILVVIALGFIFKRRNNVISQASVILLLASIPLYLVASFFMLFQVAWPYSAGPVFTTLGILASIHWADTINKISINVRRKFVAAYVISSIFLIGFFIMSREFYQPNSSESTSFAEFDLIRDDTGWITISEAFNKIARFEESKGNMQPNSDLVSFPKFLLAHEDFFIARPKRRKLFLLLASKDSSNLWINERLGGLQNGKDYYFIKLSSQGDVGEGILKNNFNKVELFDTVWISPPNAFKSYDHYALIYGLKGYKN